ncbi:hypothetical protein LVT00_10410 [Klebsiella variicola subsp. variicola]|nr:hypothetical protein [Klebsiella variicola subsp. variicola]
MAHNRVTLNREGYKFLCV